MLYLFEDRSYLSTQELKELHNLLDQNLKLSKGMLKALRRKIDAQ